MSIEYLVAGDRASTGAAKREVRFRKTARLSLALEKTSRLSPSFRPRVSPEFPEFPEFPLAEWPTVVPGELDTPTGEI